MQPLYPRIGLVLRTLYLFRRALAHFSRMDFSIFPGWTGYVFWRLGLVRLWQRRFTPRLLRPTPPLKRRSGAAAQPALSVLPSSPQEP